MFSAAPPPTRRHTLTLESHLLMRGAAGKPKATLHLCLMFGGATCLESSCGKCGAAGRTWSSRPTSGPPRAPGMGSSASSDFDSCNSSSNPRAASVWPPSLQLLGTHGSRSCCQIPAWRWRRGPGAPGGGGPAGVGHHHLRRLIPQGRCPPRPLGHSPLRPRSQCVCLGLSRQAWQGDSSQMSSPHPGAVLAADSD